jgi:hypothetical protein
MSGFRSSNSESHLLILENGPPRSCTYWTHRRLGDAAAALRAPWRWSSHATSILNRHISCSGQHDAASFASSIKLLQPPDSRRFVVLSFNTHSPRSAESYTASYELKGVDQFHISIAVSRVFPRVRRKATQDIVADLWNLGLNTPSRNGNSGSET